MYCLLKGKATIDMVLGMGKPEMLPKQKLYDVCGWIYENLHRRLIYINLSEFTAKISLKSTAICSIL